MPTTPSLPQNPPTSSSDASAPGNSPVRFLKEFFRQRFGERVQKVPLDAGFTCPNRDGTLSSAGCSFCLPAAFSPFYCRSTQSVPEQLQAGIRFYASKYRVRRFLPYFQAFSGTYAPTKVLASLCSSVLAVPGVVGVMIATRPDCLADETLDYLADLNTRVFVGIELGIESCSDQVLQRLNRGHTFHQTRDALARCARRGLFVTGHLIFGLPGEASEAHLQWAELFSRLPIQALKLHHLQILSGTPLAAEFSRSPSDFPAFSFEQYLHLLMAFLERLSPRLFIDRLNTRSPRELLISPRWGPVANTPEPTLLRLLQRFHTFQGRRENLSLAK